MVSLPVRIDPADSALGSIVERSVYTVRGNSPEPPQPYFWSQNADRGLQIQNTSDVTMLPGPLTRITTILPQTADLTMCNMRTVRLLPHPKRINAIPCTLRLSVDRIRSQPLSSDRLIPICFHMTLIYRNARNTCVNWNWRFSALRSISFMPLHSKYDAKWRACGQNIPLACQPCRRLHRRRSQASKSTLHF